MGSADNIVHNQLALVNGLLKRLLENTGVKKELGSNLELTFEIKSKITSMIKIQERLQRSEEHTSELQSH